MNAKTQPKLKPTVQVWGNSMALRIPKRIAVQVRLTVGQPVDFKVVDGSVVVTPEGKPKLSLEQLLKKFDPAIHGGEVNTGGLVGAERF
jgi:antitoxin MazE